MYITPFLGPVGFFIAFCCAPTFNENVYTGRVGEGEIQGTMF